MKRIRNFVPAYVLAALSVWRGRRLRNSCRSFRKPISRTIELPGEFQPFQSVSMHAKVRATWIACWSIAAAPSSKDNCSSELSAPEMTAQIAEAESKVQAAESDRLQAEAQLAAAQSTYDRLKKAAETPGAIAGNELIQAEKQVEAAQALVQSKRQAVAAAEAAVRAQKDLKAYLRITAPFDGVVTDRLVHPGALVGSRRRSRLLVIQQVSHLRLVVAVPEENIGGIVRGARVEFHVPAYPERTYSGTVARISHALDQKTRTMAVELDVLNRDGSLSPGMYPSVKWPVRRSRPSLLVPKTSVVTTTERTSVVRNQNGHAEWINVVKGSAEGNLVEVSGNLQAGDKVVLRGADEIQEGAPLDSSGSKAR